MTASLVPVSHGEPMVFTQSEATAAQATWVFFLTNTADGTVATGKTISGSDFRISKAGGAFGNATGTVTEISLGWYKMVFAAGDLDTIGALACELSVEAGVDPIHCVHQVTLFDLNIATAPLAAGAISSTTFASAAITAAAIATDAVGAAELAADAVTEIQAGLATAVGVAAIAVPARSRTIALGTKTTNSASLGVDCKQALAVVLTATGTFDSGTMTVQTCADPAATSPVWVDTALTLTSNGSKTVVLPVGAARWNLTGSTTPSIVCTATVSYPA